jgi:glycosyltransferase involved in cell wall biosynthesis
VTGPHPAAFAIPGDIATRTGGYIYERSLLEALRAAGREVAHVQLPGSFPDAGPQDMAEAVARLRAVPPGMPLILDGLVSGAIDTAGLASVAAPVCAMVHHPLALESGLLRARADELARRERDNLAAAAHVLVPSPHTAAILRADYGVPNEKITIAPPGFPRPAPLAVPKQAPPLILSVGILHPRKGHDVLLAALARIVGLDWQAEIVGPAYDPVCADALHRQRAALGLGARVKFAGSLSDPALQARYAAATVFALATRYEGYGMVLGEALLHGLPVVSVRTGAVPDTVPPGAGVLVPPDAPEALAQALERMLTDRRFRSAVAAASAAAGARLPQWRETAAIVGQVLDRVAG